MLILRIESTAYLFHFSDTYIIRPHLFFINIFQIVYSYLIGINNYNKRSFETKKQFEAKVNILLNKLYTWPICVPKIKKKYLNKCKIVFIASTSLSFTKSHLADFGPTYANHISCLKQVSKTRNLKL